MRFAPALMLLILPTVLAFAQDLVNSRRTSYHTFIYQLNEDEARKIYKDKVWNVDSSFLHTLVDDYPTDSLYKEDLLKGHYLRTYVEGADLKIDILTIQDFDVHVMNNSSDLNVQVVNKSGEALSNAKVRSGIKRLRFDKKTKTYRSRKSNSRGILSVELDGFTTYYDLERQHNNPLAKRVLRDVIYKTPLKYAWRPVAFTISLPLDGVKSIIHQYPQGAINTIVWKSRRWFEKLVCLFDDYYCDDHDYQFSQKYNGYVAFSKPKYLPGDTVQVKSFITSKRGRPLKKDLQVVLERGYGDHLILDTISPYSNGGYAYQLVLDDSLDLKLDRSYSISFRKKGSKEYISRSFQFEEYELGKIELTITSNNQVQYRGEEAVIEVSGTDENGLNLLDARLEVVITTKEVLKYCEEEVFVPNVIHHMELSLDPEDVTEIIIPDTLFPSVNMEYAVGINLLTSDNERTSETEYIGFIHQEDEIDFVLEKDSVRITRIVNGKAVPSQFATIQSFDFFGNEIERKECSLPVTLPLNSYHAELSVISDQTESYFDLTNEPSELSFYTSRTSDSLHIRSSNPHGIPFVYYLYKTNHELKRGNGKKLNLDIKTWSDENYYLAVQYLWAGEVHEENYLIAFNKKELNVVISTPPVAYPGQKVNVDVLVTDQKGKPVSGVDLTAQGLTSKFKYSPPTLPVLDKPKKSRLLINSFEVDERELTNSLNRSYDYDKWNTLAGLDSIAYFQFIYPGEGVFEYAYTPNDSVTQFAPFVVDEGVIQPIKAVFVDRSPVYLAWSHDVPYSFPVDSGYHHVMIQSRSYEYTLDSVYFPHGQKLIFSFDHEQLPDNVSVYEQSAKQTERQELSLHRYMLAYTHTFDDQFGYFRRGDHYIPVMPLVSQSGYHYRRLDSPTTFVGPVANVILDFKLYDGFKQSFLHEPFYNYELRVGLIKMKCIDFGAKLPKLSVSPFIWTFSDEAWTEKKLDDWWENELVSRRMASRRYQNPASTMSHRGMLLLHMDHQSDSLRAEVLNTLIFNYADASDMRIYPGVQGIFHNLEESYYRVIFLRGDGSYMTIDSIEVKSGGKNRLALGLMHLQEADSFSMELNQLMEEYFENKNSNPLYLEEKRQIQRVYQQNYQYFGAGEVVSGYVFDGESGEALPGVTIVAKGTSYGTVSDLEGFYSMRVPYGSSVLTYSFVGFTSQEKDLGQTVSADVYLKADVQHLDEVVVVGYGVQKKQMLTGSVVTVHSNALAGKIAGVSVAPGAQPNILIRGANSINMENTPLYVIDGVPYLGDINALDASNFQSMDMLKGESATALYGARAANGVVIITTGDAVSLTVSNLSESEGESLFIGASNANSIRSNFSDVAFWEPQLTTNKKGKASFEIVLPDDITRWDAHAYAMNGKRQSGQGSSSIKSFKPLAAQLNLPRFLLKGDTSFAIGKSLNYTFDSVTVTSSFMIDGVERRGSLVSFKNSQIDTLTIIPEVEDSLLVRYSLHREDGYFDGEERELPVYPIGVKKSIGHYAALSRDTVVMWDFDPEKGPVTFYANTKSLDILQDHIQYLIDYPYGCNEQLASKLKAQLVAKKFDDKLNIEGVKDREIKKLIRKLINNQNDEGLWGWWNISSHNLWISTHVIEALILADGMGFSIDGLKVERILEEAIWHIDSNRPDSERLDWLYIASKLDIKLDLTKWISTIDTTALSMKAKLRWCQVQKDSNSTPSVKWINDSLNITMNEGAYLSQSRPSRFRSFYSDQSLQLTTMAYDVLKWDTTYQKQSNQMEDYLLDRISSSRGYYNTYELSNMIVALADRLSAVEGSLEPSLKLSGGIQEEVKGFPFKSLVDKPTQLVLEQKGLLPIYATAYQTYWEHEAIASQNDFNIHSYFEGEVLLLKAGEPVTLTSKVEVLGDAEYVMIEIPIPAGCSYQDKKQHYYPEVHREYFKEKVSIFCRKLGKGTYEFEVELLPRYSGSYTLNPAKVELMYFPVQYAHEGLKRVRID